MSFELYADSIRNYDLDGFWLISLPFLSASDLHVGPSEFAAFFMVECLIDLLPETCLILMPSYSNMIIQISLIVPPVRIPPFGLHQSFKLFMPLKLA